MRTVFALVDCNNFYASCECVFAPGLAGRPIAVLSNNDGVVIARSEETKKLGIPMGGPVFKYEQTIRKHGIAIFSSNFALYGDFSSRVMDVLHGLAPKMEVYSIDEAFLQLDGIDPGSLDQFGRRISDKVRKWTGIPVSVGIATSKTLAKAANEIAKKNEKFSGVLNLANKRDPDALLMCLPVSDVWGVGREYAKWLVKSGIYSAYDLKNSELGWIKKKMGVNGERLLKELNGESCIPLEANLPPSKQIICSRSFHETTSEKWQMQKAVALYATRAAEKLRKQKGAAGEISVFVATSRFGDRARYFNAARRKFRVATAFTPKLVKAALLLLDEIFRPGYSYKKTGVMLSKISSDTSLQTNLLEQKPDLGRQRRLMDAMDKINEQWGRHTISIAQSGAGQTWMMRQTRRSGRYTTRWDELPRVAA